MVGADALPLTDLESFHPEKGMVLANTTSLGMQPNVNETPLAKVYMSLIGALFYLCSIYSIDKLIMKCLKNCRVVWGVMIWCLMLFIHQKRLDF